MINIFKLNTIRDEKELLKHETYRKVLEKCHYKIQSNASKGLTYCFYTLPEFMIGLPTYDKLKCAEYIVNKLRKNGFVVMFTYPSLIYASWEHVPSSIKNPDVKDIEVEILTNPYKDYSNVIKQISMESDTKSTITEHNNRVSSSSQYFYNDNSNESSSLQLYNRSNSFSYDRKKYY